MCNEIFVTRKFKTISLTTTTQEAPSTSLDSTRHSSILDKMKQKRSQTALDSSSPYDDCVRSCESVLRRFQDFTLMKESISTGLGIASTVLIATVVTGYPRHCTVRGEIPDFDDLNRCGLSSRPAPQRTFQCCPRSPFL
jgi:hypothetical protein